MPFAWPEGFPRIPDEAWTRLPLEDLARKYDTVEHHGWYANLEPSVQDLWGFVEEGDIVVDYSGGTGILIDRLLAALPRRGFGVVNVDSSPKFLRLSLEKLRGEERVGFRLLRFLKEEGRLQFLDEALGPALVGRGVEAIVSTNAVHLYYDLEDTLRGWHRCLRDDGRLFVQSGNIRPPGSAKERWIIDDTVDAVHQAATQVAREQPRFAAYRAVLDDADRMQAYAALRDKFFLPPRPLQFYVRELEGAGFDVLGVQTRGIRARVADWTEFLSVYHEGVLGWVGGSERVEGRPPSEQAVKDRLDLLRLAVQRIFAGRDAFDATWTYLTCAKRLPR
jgi:SAM-dependent methyltransferase